MAKSINQVILMGRLTRDPEQRTTTTGKTIVSFSIAVDRVGQDDSADFFNVTAWEKLGELVMQYLAKGRRVLVQGRLRQDSWDDKETGKKRSSVEVTATDVTFLDGPSDNAGSAQASSPRTSSKKTEDIVIEDIDDKPIDLSEIPFQEIWRKTMIIKRFKKDMPVYFDYKDVKTLQRYIDIYGQIKSVSKTGLSAKQQRQLAVAIKRARHLALLPFMIQGQVKMSYQPTELKKGVVIQLDGKPFRVIEYNQKVVGRGGSIVNVKIKNLIDGSLIPKTFKGQERIDSAEVTSRTVQYLYTDGTKYYFMDPETFEQFELSDDIVDGAINYLKEGDDLLLQSFNDTIINVELPKNVYLEVTQSENAVKGDTSSSIQKDATVETGLIVKVPAFIKVGDVISVDTSTGEYRERKKG